MKGFRAEELFLLKGFHEEPFEGAMTMFGAVSTFFGGKTTEGPEVSSDADYWKGMKDGGSFAAHKAMLETLWKQEELLKHLEIRSNVAGMGKLSCKERLEKQQWLLYLNALFCLKKQFKVYLAVLELWWDRKVVETMAEDGGHAKCQRMLKDELPIKHLAAEMWQMEFLLATADMDRLMCEKLFDVAQDHMENCSAWGQKNFEEEYLQALEKKKEVQLTVMAVVKQMDFKVEWLKAHETLVEKLQAVKAEVAAVWKAEGEKLLKECVQEIAGEEWMQKSYRTAEC